MMKILPIAMKLLKKGINMATVAPGMPTTLKTAAYTTVNSLLHRLIAAPAEVVIINPPNSKLILMNKELRILKLRMDKATSALTVTPMRSTKSSKMTSCRIAASSASASTATLPTKLPYTTET